MKRITLKTLYFLAVLFVLLELFSRFVIDPVYFYAIDSYEEKNGFSYQDFYNGIETEHVDYLFVGSSRIPATINTKLLRELSGGKVAINAGRGYMMPGIHYQALKNKLISNPDYLRNSFVFLEYAGTRTYTFNFYYDRLRVYEPIVEADNAMPHLLLPHLNFSALIDFLVYSGNSIPTKVELATLYLSSSYRCKQFINEKFHLSLDKNFLFKNNDSLIAEGGIRSDLVEFARQKAIVVAEQEKDSIFKEPLLTFDIINRSTLAKLNNLIRSNGGTLVLYKMPLHSIQQNVFNLDKAKKNQEVFESWLKSNDIEIIENSEFIFNDTDFPDTWHLSSKRRDEFTSKLYKQISKFPATITNR